MAVLPIVLHPDPILRRKARPVQKIGPALRRLLDDMVETMYAAPGVGLAGPQVGVLKRVIVADCGEPHGLLKLINPEILEAEGAEVGTEGCLSIPGYVGEVERAARIKVTALTPEGRRVWIEAEGLWARCLQHEIDHLDGVLYIDKATNVREVPPAEAEEKAEGGSEAESDPAAVRGGEDG